MLALGTLQSQRCVCRQKFEAPCTPQTSARSTAVAAHDNIALITFFPTTSPSPTALTVLKCHKLGHGEEVVVRPRQVRREDEGEAAKDAVARDFAEPGLAARALVARPPRLDVGAIPKHPRTIKPTQHGKAHAYQRRRRAIRRRRRRDDMVAHQLAVVLLSERDMVEAARADGDRPQDRQLRTQADGGGADFVRHKLADDVVDIARVARRERAEGDEHLARAVGGDGREERAGEDEGVLERRVAVRAEAQRLGDGVDVQRRVRREAAEARGDGVARHDDGELRDRVLVEVLADEDCCGAADGLGARRFQVG